MKQGAGLRPRAFTLGPVVASDPRGESTEPGAEVVQKQGDGVEGQGDRLPEFSAGR